MQKRERTSRRRKENIIIEKAVVDYDRRFISSLLSRPFSSPVPPLLLSPLVQEERERKECTLHRKKKT